MSPILAVWPILTFCSFALTLRAEHTAAAPTTLAIEFNAAAGATDAVPISKSLASLSIEFCYILDYLGDVDAPNELTLRLLENVQNILGTAPIIRIGGHTQDVAQYNASNPETLTNIFAPGNLEAVNVTFNSGLFRVLTENAVSTQQFILGLNFGQDNVEFPLAEVSIAESLLHPGRLYAYELGNEPDFYSSSQKPSPWNVDTYAQQQLDWTSKIQTKIKHSGHGFQLGAFAQEPIYMGNFSLQELTILDVPESIGHVKSYSDHTYPYSVCTSLFNVPRLPG
jgi:hypothetical protein